jgi:hypothetical protein
MTEQKIYNQARQREWVRKARRYTRAKLDVGNQTIEVTGEFPNEHAAKLAVLRAYLHSHDDLSHWAVLKVIDELLDEVEVE